MFRGMIRSKCPLSLDNLLGRPLSHIDSASHFRQTNYQPYVSFSWFLLFPGSAYKGRETPLDEEKHQKHQENIIFRRLRRAKITFEFSLRRRRFSLDSSFVNMKNMFLPSNGPKKSPAAAQKYPPEHGNHKMFWK